MMKRFLISLLAIGCLLAAPLPALAFDPFGHACDASSTNDAVACKTNQDVVAQSGPQQLLLDITDVVAYIAGALAVVMILVGAFRYITAGSDVSTGSRTDTDVEDARRTIANSLLGLAVIILAKVIITYAIRRL